MHRACFFRLRYQSHRLRQHQQIPLTSQSRDGRWSQGELVSNGGRLYSKQGISNSRHPRHSGNAGHPVHRPRRSFTTAARPRQVKQQTQRQQINDPVGLFDRNGAAKIDPIYLRDSCRCELCIDPSTQQRNFLTAHIPLDIKAIYRGNTTDGAVRVEWKNDISGSDGSRKHLQVDTQQREQEQGQEQAYRKKHVSHFSQSQIQSLVQPDPYPSPAILRRNRKLLWNKGIFASRGSWTSYKSFIHDHEAYRAAMRCLHRDGLIFLTDVPQDPDAITTIATPSLLGPIRNTFYGPTWDVRSIVNSKNVAYTNSHLGLHMDLLYMSNPPGYQLLHVLQNHCRGGESLFADAFQAAESLRQTHPEAYETLTRFEVEWKYENDGQWYRQRRPTFQSIEPTLASLEGSNSIHDLAHVNWSPPFQGNIPPQPYLPSGGSDAFPTSASASNDTPFPHNTNDDDSNTYKNFIHAASLFDSILNSPDNVYELKMQPGTCVIFENRRIVHARNAFSFDNNCNSSDRSSSSGDSGGGGGGDSGGDSDGASAAKNLNIMGGGGGGGRWLRGAYVDSEAIWSRWKAENII